MGMFDIGKDWGIFRNGLSTGKILGCFSLLYTRHWERNSPFSRTITYKTIPNLHELLTKEFNVRVAKLQF
jgi:hypothetical protein